MSLNDKLFNIASSAVEKQRKTRDGRNSVSKGFDVATNKSYANEDKKVAAAALRDWENSTWKPKVAAKLKQEIKSRAPHLKPGTKAYQQTYDSLFNKNYKDLQSAKAQAQQQIGTLRKPKQTQRQLDNDYRTNESIRNDTVGTQAAAHAARDTASAVGGALATGSSRLLRAPLQLAADVGENDDGGIFDRGAKALEGYEDNIRDNVYESYGDIQQNGSFSQKLALSAVEQVPALAASFGVAGGAAKGVQLLGAGAKTAAATSYGTAAATMYPQAYLDGSDSTKDELEGATAEQLASAERSQDIYKSMFDRNIKAGMSEDEAYAKARDQTISEIAEESGENVGLATLALSMLAPGVGSFSANQVAGGAVTKWGQKVFNKLAVRADAGKVAKYAIPTAVGAGIVGLNVAEEGLQEGYTDLVAQQAAVDVGVKSEINREQSTEAVLMGGILGGLMGGGVYVGTRNSKLHQAQDDLKTAQQAYAEVAGQIPQLQQQIEGVSPRSPEGQALTTRLEETKAVLDAMAGEASKAGIPRTSLARRAPRIDPTNSTTDNFDGQVDGATELNGQDFENALNPDGTPATQTEPVVDVELSEQELDAQDAQIAELIAEQEALDEAIEDGSNEKPLEESIAAAQSWYNSKRGEGKQGLAGVVSRAAATEQDAAFAQQQEGIKGATASINDYIASERAKQQQIDAQLQQEAQAANTDAEKQAVAQKVEQREADRVKEDELLSTREQLAQPYEAESFDTTIIGADGAPFNLARFWDNNMPATAKAKAIADAFGGQVDQNVAKADWQSMPEGVQKELHQWMTERLDGVRQSREGWDGKAAEVATPETQPQEVAPTTGLTMPVQQAPTQLTEQNPTVNIPAPNKVTGAAPAQSKAETRALKGNVISKASAVNEQSSKSDSAATVYKSKPMARAAIKKQKLDPDSVTINKAEGGGFEIVPNAPAKPADNDLLARNSKKATKKDGSPKYFLSDAKSQQFIIDNDIGATHEVVDRMEGKQERFEILPKKQTSEASQTSEAEPLLNNNTEASLVGEQSTPAKKAEANKVASEKSQNDVTAETKSRFADNKLFTEDKVAAARARLKSKLTQVNSGLDPEILMDGMTLAGAYIESGVRKFGDYAKMMMEDVGVEVKPYLLSFWEGTRHYPGLDTTSMTSPEESKREFDALNATMNNNDTEQDADNDTGTSNQDDRQRADGELSAAAEANESEQDAGRVQGESTSDIPNVDGRSNRSDTNNGDEAGQSAGTNKRAAPTNVGSGTGSTQSNDGAAKKPARNAAVKAANYEIPVRDNSSKQPSWFEIGERNVEIIELVQRLESEGRNATPDEQALLADYKGWGSSKIEIFPHPTKGYSSPRWEVLGEKLKSLLTESEYATARRTTQYAHYTPPSIVNGIYAALEQFGFKGGQVFEPASGIGVFNGLMPRDMASKSSYVGVELDPMTALIAKHLYPLSDMSMGDYTKVKLPDNHFDVAVGNPPFADISYSYGAGKNKKPYLIHDYFFAKTLDKLKPGGVMAFVTSKGSMDKTNSAARESFAEQADLIGAIRLPNTAFKDEAGTAVVTDIIFLRKRLEGEASNGVKWTDTKEKTIDDQNVSINEYFIDNPNMVLGRNAITSGQFGPTYTVESDSNNLASQIETAIAQLPKDIFTPARGSNAEAAKVAEIDYGIKSSQQREGGVYVKDGKLMKVIDGVGKPLTHRYGTNGKRIELTGAQVKFLTDYTGVRDAFKQSQQDQLNDNPNWQESLDNLNTAYDNFVKKHGRLMAHTISTTERADGKEITTTRFANKAILFLDVDGYVASALENIVDGEVVGKNAVIEKGSYFKGRTLNKPKTPTIKTTQDALVYVLNEVGTPDVKQIAKLINKSEQEVIADLGSQVFTNPETGAVEMAEIYLSGNVVEKLATAEAMAAKDNRYKKNIDALKDVQPNFIAPNDISSNLGSGWIPGEVIKQFSQEVLDANITANYSGAAGVWDVSGHSRNSDYRTPSKTTVELMDSILNSREIKVSYTVDGKSYTDAEKTELATQMAGKIQKAFKDWIWKDTERANTLAEYYNKNYNNIVPPTFNGDHLTLAGMSSKIQLRPHQKTGIYRVVSQGDVYLNHAVGAGKTFTMIAAAMEEKRLGLINKPMFVVPNHMLAQFSQEFLMLYPAADIVVADEQNFHTHNRKQFVAEISVNNPDAIIITHTAFGKIGVKPETQQKFLENTLNDWREALLSAKSMKGGDNSQSVRQLERNIQAMETKLTDLLKAEAKDDTTFFEDMGVDKLIVDEMHEYRKLSYATRQGRIKGIVSTGSQMASDLQMKIELIREKNPTRAIVGASGTPVTNTMGELFSVQTYFQPKQLRKDGLHHFDNWSNQFGEVVKGLEQNAAGNYEVVPRFAKFLNVPELMSRVRWFMDVLTSDQLGDVVQRPDIVGGGRQIISVPAPDGFDAFQQSLADRITATRNRSGKPEKGADNILKIINDGRFGAIDLRFTNPDLPSDPNSKLNRAIADMAQAYHDTANNEYHDGKGNIDELNGGAQMLFTNIGLGAQSAASTGFDMKAWINSELIRLGVDPEHIAFMADANSHAKKGKLFEDMRQGRKRILIGGSNMETGVNAQKRLTHLAHLDSPWFPATVEQREGRIIRQGNQNKEVTIRAYATKGSYDSTMWGMVARKARFIQQAMNGDISMRHMDDISEASAFEQASALSSGDPRALQLAGLAADVERLDRYYSAYENARIENSREAKRSKESAVRAERELSEVNALLETHKDIETGGVIGKVGSKTFDNRQEFGEAIIKAFDKLKATKAQGEHVLGTASGYNVVYNGVMLGETFVADADISIPKSNDNVLFDNNSGEVSASGITTSIINRVNGLADYKSAIQKKIEGFKKDAENFERRASQSFENEVERKEKHAEYKELDDTLRAEAAAIKAQASGSNSSTPLTDADRVPAKDKPKFSRMAPNGKPTNLNEQQWLQVRTPAFKEWFGDWENDAENASKVVDENGEPKIMYHGSPIGQTFNVFEGDANGSIYTSDSREYASNYADDADSFTKGVSEDKKVFEVFVDAKNYFDNTNSEHVSKLADAILENNETSNAGNGETALVIDGEKSLYAKDVIEYTLQDGEGYNWRFMKEPWTQKAIKALGFDGFSVFEGDNDTAIAVYESNQIKSATENAGTFDTTNKDIRYSKTNPAKGLTGTTSQQVITVLQNRFGKEVVASLVKSGKLRVRTLNDFVNADGRLLIPSDAEGFYYDGKVTLIADNLTPETVVATLLHELGGHAGIQSMLAPQTYMSLMENFYALVRSGNKYAVRAKSRAEAMTGSDSEARDEYIPYLITEYAQATEQGGPLAVIKRFVNRVMAGVRAWVRDNTGVQLKITPNDMTQLAERMVKRLSEQNASDMTIADVENMLAGQIQFSQEDASQTDTPAFKEWFGNSKVLDSNGDPLIVYHGTIKSFNEFNTTDFGALLGKGSYFTADEGEARQYSGQGTRIVPTYLSIKNPYYVKSSMDIVPSREEMLSSGYDGVIQKNDDGSVKWAVAHKPTQIKSATSNIGTFDSSSPDIRFSRRYSTLGTDGKPTTAKERARDRVALAQATTMSSKFGVNLLLRRHLATPQHVALLNPIFKIFTDNVQARIAYENNEAGLVQTLLPEIWDTRLIFGKKKEAMERVSKAIFDGTMADTVWSDSELQTKFELTDQDINFYRRARAAIDKSVMNMTLDTLSSLAKGTKLINIHTANRLKLSGLHPIFHNLALQKHMTDELERLAKGGLITPKAEARMQKQLDAVFDVMSAVAGKYDKLVEDGYAPLMRFGHYAVEVRDKVSNDLDLFELYETKGQQRKAIKELKERYDESQFTVGTGTLNPEGFKQFKNKGLSPETVQLFAAELGLDKDGAYQAYLKIAVSDRSALKRLIHRKKVPGYSEDMPRVLSSFVMSNARYSGRSLYNGEIEKSIQDIEDGNLQNEAQKVFENMEDPQEEFAQQRSLMFFYFMGFSPAFFFLNLTQPFTQTIPKLTAYVGAGKGHAYMAQALGMVGRHMGSSAINMGKKVVGMPTPNWKGFEDKLPAWVKKEDYLRMAREGHLDPQNIYMIKGLERGKGGVASGVWGNIQAAAGWFAEVSESINRRSTMIAAFRVAKDMGAAKLKAKGFNNEYDFAVSVIQQTQGIYNKGNRSGLARGNGKLGQYGPLILVFKQFTINYTEQMIRHGRDKEAKSIAVAMAWQFGLAGMLGLPFADDLRDIIEGLLYRVFGKAFNLPDYLEGLLGKSNADALMYGLASEKGRIDLFGRSSLGNIIPGTDVVRPGPTDWAEILGASSGFYESFFSAAAMATEGHYKDALITASPRFIRDAASGAEIAMTGSYRNTKGDKIMDLDKTDAVIKSLAFNPANNAKPGRDRSNAYNMKNMLKAKTDYFSKHLAEAIYQENDERIDELYVEMDAWNDRNAEHFNVDVDKIEKSAEKRVERKDFGSAERQNIQDSLALRQEDLAGT